MMVLSKSAFSQVQTQPFSTGRVQTFSLPGLLPENTRLLLDIQHFTAILVRFEEGGVTFDLAATHPSFRLTPASTQVFLTLLQASPGYCSYRTLFAALYPLPQERSRNRVWSPTLALRPIRRALATLGPTLRGLGLQVVSLRGQGYILALLPEAERFGPESVGRMYPERAVTSSRILASSGGTVEAETRPVHLAR